MGLSVPRTRWPCVSVRLNEVVWLSCYFPYAGTEYSLENEHACVSWLLCVYFLAVCHTNMLTLLARLGRGRSEPCLVPDFGKLKEILTAQQLDV